MSVRAQGLAERSQVYLFAIVVYTEWLEYRRLTVAKAVVVDVRYALGAVLKRPPLLVGVDRVLGGAVWAPRRTSPTAKHRRKGRCRVLGPPAGNKAGSAKSDIRPRPPELVDRTRYA